MIIKNMTIKKRLVVSNILMILVPVMITALTALACVGIFWFSVTHSVGVGFEDSGDFYKARQNIAMIVENSLGEMSRGDQSDRLSELNQALDKRSMTLSVDSSGESIYQYGLSTDADETLLEAVATLGGEGFVSNGSRELYVQQTEIDGIVYRIAIFVSPPELSNGTLKIAIALSVVSLIFAIFFSILLTNRFLTKFVFQKIEHPLNILSNGVRQISEGNLEYRIAYESEDEFAPVCADFNEMAEVKKLLLDQKAFLDEHLLAWIGNFATQIQQSKTHYFYPQVALLTEKVLKIDAALLEELITTL